VVERAHALIPGTSILIAALLLPYCVRSKCTAPVIFLALSSSLYIEGHYTHIVLLKNIQSTYSAAWHGLLNRLKDATWLNNNFMLTMDFLHAKNAFPVMPGTSDIYSYDQTDLIASGNTWSPRPIIQSYSVFNQSLAQLNKQHLLDTNGPDTVFFKLQAIDHRLPSLEDGISWPVLISNYEVTTWVKDYLLLGKKPEKKKYIPATQALGEQHTFGEWVHIPTTSSLVFISLELKPRLWGMVMGLLFKAQELIILVCLNDGSEKQYRLIPAMARSGFLLSPLIENTYEFSLLYQRKKVLSHKQVHSFMIKPEGSIVSSMWNYDYELYYQLIN
jgi:hypothetical protein